MSNPYTDWSIVDLERTTQDTSQRYHSLLHHIINTDLPFDGDAYELAEPIANLQVELMQWCAITKALNAAKTEAATAA